MLTIEIRLHICEDFVFRSCVLISDMARCFVMKGIIDDNTQMGQEHVSDGG